jgi:hypothetical protein
MELVIGWLILAAIVGAAANARGRSFVQWFFGAVLISPLLAGILVLVLPRRKTAETPKADARLRAPCPSCRELIVYGAAKCHFCGTEIAPAAQDG